MAGATQHTVSESTLVKEERTGSVVTLRLNRPEKLNAISPELSRALIHGLLRASEDRTVRAVVLTGAGRAFSSGGDLAVMRDLRNRRATAEFQAMLTLGKEICLAIARMPKPVIAAVNGVAAGGGMALALACDLRVASDQATFVQSFSNVGLYPDFGATYFLPRIVGLSRASELFYTGETLSAERAREMGIVYKVFSAAEFENGVQEISHKLATGPGIAFRDVKHTIIGENQDQLIETLDEEIRLQLHCFVSEDFAEGIAAFFEKRKPKFRA